MCIVQTVYLVVCVFLLYRFFFSSFNIATYFHFSVCFFFFFLFSSFTVGQVILTTNKVANCKETPKIHEYSLVVKFLVQLYFIFLHNFMDGACYRVSGVARMFFLPVMQVVPENSR